MDAPDFRTSTESEAGEAPDLGGAWKVLDRRMVADRSPFAVIWDEDLLLPDGSTITNFIRVDIVPFAIVFAQLEDGRVPFVRQYRQAIGRVSLELPAGHIEKGEEPLHCAQRELLEEAGAVSDDWQFMGHYVLEANRGCGHAHLFLARNARLVSLPEVAAVVAPGAPVAMRATSGSRLLRQPISGTPASVSVASSWSASAASCARL